MTRRWTWAAATMALLLFAAACGDDNDDGGSSGSAETTEAGGETLGGEPLAALGEGEGSLNVLAWPYYAEDGTQSSPDLDWVTAFEQDTGCDTKVTYFGTSDEAVQQFQSGEFDVVSASGDASLRLVYGGDAAPINTELVDTYADLASFLKEQQNNSVDGVVYGVPHGWGANLLQWNADEVTEAPDSWGAVFDTESPYAGKITAYDSPIYIADAAVFLKATQPELGIDNPYALDEDQLAAAVDLLKEQKSIIGEYWSDYTKLEDAYNTGSIVMGTSWQVIANTLTDPAYFDPPVNVKTVLPTEGSTAWSDNWMVHPDAAHPNCAYRWLSYITSPDVQATVATTFGEAPANLKACEQISDHCVQYGAEDEAFYGQLYYWTIPQSECLDGRTDVECTDYTDWTRAWDEVKG